MDNWLSLNSVGRELAFTSMDTLFDSCFCSIPDGTFVIFNRKYCCVVTFRAQTTDLRVFAVTESLIKGFKTNDNE